MLQIHRELVYWLSQRPQDPITSQKPMSWHANPNTWGYGDISYSNDSTSFKAIGRSLNSLSLSLLVLNHFHFPSFRLRLTSVPWVQRTGIPRQAFVSGDLDSLHSMNGPGTVSTLFAWLWRKAPMFWWEGGDHKSTKVPLGR
jgi:hypothetical protein